MALCTVTGAVYFPSGELARSTMIKFSRVDKSVNAEYLGAVVPEGVCVKTDRLGQVDFQILTGKYIMSVGEYSGGAVVPEAMNATIADILTIVTPSIPVPAWLTQALAARDAAIAAADDAQDSADDAAASASEAAADAVVGSAALVVANRAEGKADGALLDASEANLVAARAREAAGLVPQQFGDGAGGWQIAINAAIEALSAGQGGRLVLPALDAPYETSAPIVVRSNIEVDFGKASIRLANGANCDMIQTDGFYSLTGTNNYMPDGSPSNFSITGGVFDGNRANQSPANPDMCNGLALYGYGFTVRDMEVLNVRGHGLRLEWGDYGGGQIGHSMEALVENCRFDTAGRHGIWYQGPHDGCFSHVIVIDPSQEADNTYDGIYCGPTGGARWFNPHVWHRATVTNRARWSANFVNGGNEVTTGHFEGARKQLRVTGNCDVRGVQMYAPNSNDPQIEVSGERNVISGRFRANAAFKRPIVLALGDTSGAAINNIDLQYQVDPTGPSNPVFRVTNSLGNNIVRARGVGGVAAAFVSGSWNSSDSVDISQQYPSVYVDKTPSPVAASVKKAIGMTPFDFGASGTGDSGPAIQAAVDYCTAQGGGTVVLPDIGTSWNTGQTILHDARVSLKGSGKTKLFALAGLAGRILETRNFDALASAGNSASGGSQAFTIEGIVFDCNAANRGGFSAGGGDGVCLYGRDFTLKNVYIKDAPRHALRGLYMNVSGSGTSPYNANLDGVMIDVCGGHGIDWQISDSNWNDINVASPSQAANNTYDAVYATKLIRWSNGAIWRKGVSPNTHRYGINLDGGGGNSILGVNIETAQTAAIRNAADRSRFSVYTYNILDGQHVLNTASYCFFDIVAQPGGLGSSAIPIVANSGSKCEFTVSATGSLVPFSITGGNHNRYFATVFIGDGKAAYTGTVGTQDRVEITVDRNATTQQVTIIPGEVTGSAVASSAEDNTAGRLMKVGHGAMSGQQLGPSIADANDFTNANRRLRVPTSASNTPLSGQGWVIENIYLGTDVSSQVAYCTTFNGRNRLAIRHRNTTANVFNNWTHAQMVSTSIGSARPSSPLVGQMDYDTTALRPIWWNGTIWHYSDGTVA